MQKYGQGHSLGCTCGTQKSGERERAVNLRCTQQLFEIKLVHVRRQEMQSIYVSLDSQCSMLGIGMAILFYFYYIVAESNA